MAGGKRRRNSCELVGYQKQKPRNLLVADFGAVIQSLPFVVSVFGSEVDTLEGAQRGFDGKEISPKKQEQCRADASNIGAAFVLPRALSLLWAGQCPLGVAVRFFRLSRLHLVDYFFQTVNFFQGGGQASAGGGDEF